MSITPGTRLGPYEVIASLGAGGMGEVYRALDARLAREVAIKVLPADLASDPSRLKRFEKEARSASALNHPNIVTIYEIGTADSISYIAMERVEGKTLRELLFGGALPIRKLLPIAAQIADGLAKAHGAGIVHRDLKPENVMVTKDGLVKILDFGLAKLTQPSSGSDEGSRVPTQTGTTPGAIVGTAGYMSPEQAAGQPLDFRSDQFSFGSILYEMATGKRAFQKKTAVDTLSTILNDEPMPMGEVNPQTPAPLRWIVERCLAKEPSGRYASTEDLARDLAAVRDRLSEASFSGMAVAAPISRTRSWVRIAGLALVLAVAAASALFVGKNLGKTPLLKFQQLTFRHGHIGSARIAPDGQTIVYCASWEGNPYEIFTTRPGSFESRALGIPSGFVAISASGVMAVGLSGGTLAQVALAGGAPRELLENVREADWAPDGKTLAVIHLVKGRSRLEFPIGTVLYDSANRLNNLHVSPAGDWIAFHEVGEVVLIDPVTKKRRATGLRTTEFGWRPDGKELWFLKGGYGVSESELRAVRLGGRERAVGSLPGTYQLDDVARDGRLLIERLNLRGEIRGLAVGAERERPLSWLDSSLAADVSNDGKTVLIDETFHHIAYLRGTDGSPAVPLGEGKPLALSPDGKWALTVRAGPPPLLVLLPRGAGEARTLPSAGFESIGEASFLPDGKSVVVGARERGRAPRLYVIDIERGKSRTVGPEGIEGARKAVSPDGKLAFVRGSDGKWVICPLEAGSASSQFPISGLASDDMPIGWTADSRSLFVQDVHENPAGVYRVDWRSGKRELYHEFWPSDPAGIWGSAVFVTPDGKAWVYTCLRNLSELFLVEGVK